MRKGKFEVFEYSETYNFRLKAGNGKVLCIGQFFDRKESCLNTIEQVKKISKDAEIVEVDS